MVKNTRLTLSQSTLTILINTLLPLVYQLSVLTCIIVKLKTYISEDFYQEIFSY